MTWFEFARWVHLLAGIGWVGAVLAVVFVLGPALGASTPAERVVLLRRAFPRVFRLASALVLAVWASGAMLFLLRYGGRPVAALQDARALPLIVGAALGAAIGTFHFLVEPRLERRIALAGDDDGAGLDQLVRLLRIVPIAGLGVLVLVTSLMMASARGW